MAMSSHDKPTQPDVHDRTHWFGAVQYGIGPKLRREMALDEHVPQRFRDLVRALEKAERERGLQTNSSIGDSFIDG